MDKIYVQNLGMIVTNKCNMDCKHCLRGCKDDKEMTDEVIDATLNEITGIGNLCICGGEPLLALDIIEKIFDYVIDKKIIVDRVSITTNGTIYSLRFLMLLNKINEYILSVSNRNNTIFAISDDIYHEEELKRLNLYKDYLNNVKRYMKSKYFYQVKKINNNKKVIREGNATNLSDELTEPLEQIDILMSYDEKYEICNIGPLIAVNPDGIVTEVDGSIENQQNIYNYGNVLDDSLENIVLKKGKVMDIKQMNRKSKKLIKYYIDNN